MNRRLIALVISLCLACSLVTGALVYTFANPSPTSASYLETGVYPGAPSYTVYQEGSTYYVKNAWGMQPSWGESSNASYIIQNTFDNSANGLVFFSTGSYTLSSSVTISSTMHIVGAGNAGWDWTKNIVKLSFSGCNGLTIDPLLQTYLYVTIENIEIAGDSSHYGIWCVGNDTHRTKLNLEHVSIYGWGEAIHFEYGYFASYWNNINIGTTNGIYLKHVNGLFIDSSFIGGTPAEGSKGIYADGTLASDDATLFLSNTVIQGFQLAMYIDGWSDVDLNGINIDGVLTGVGTTYCCYFIESTSCRIKDSWLSTEDTTGTNGLKIEDCDDFLISGNTIWGNQYGLILDNTNYTIVSINNIENSGTQDIRILNSYNNVFDGNIVKSVNGILEEGTSDYNIIMDTNARVCTTCGILKLGASTQVNTSWNGTTWIS